MGRQGKCNCHKMDRCAISYLSNFPFCVQSLIAIQLNHQGVPVLLLLHTNCSFCIKKVKSTMKYDCPKKNPIDYRLLFLPHLVVLNVHLLRKCFLQATQRVSRNINRLCNPLGVLSVNNHSSGYTDHRLC